MLLIFGVEPQPEFHPVRWGDFPQPLARRRMMMRVHNNTHSILFGYLLWIFGFTGAHRFYYGKQISGTIWFFTLGLLGIGWLIDAFLIPSMDREADRKYVEGPLDYNIMWLLLTFLGVFGVHRFVMGKWLSGILYLISGGLFLVGVLYDFFTLNGQIDEINRQRYLPTRHPQYP
jgi:TM2 domain-containing membrane protein YozV